MVRALCVVAFAVVVVGCGERLGPPRVRPVPTPDTQPALRVAGVRSPRIANYKIAARYDADAHRLAATQTLTWTNRSGTTVTELPFHLYLNGFKNEASLFISSARGAHRGRALGDDGWGWIDVDSIKIGAVDVRSRSTFQGPDETVLVVPLPTPVAPGEVVDVEMAFQAQLPRALARTGFEGAFTMVAQWFPKVGVLVGAPGFERWECPPFHVNSEFFADFGVYDVELTVPQTHLVAATGVLTAATDNADETRTLRYHAEDVHDFAWMIDPHMQVMSATAMVDGTPVEVRVVYRPRQRGFARRHLQAGVGAIELFSRLFVPYPWSIMTVVDPPPGAEAIAGMEYPTLVTTGGDNVLMRPGIRVPEFVTIHEIGHNWFQGVLASNEFKEAWLDEGVNEWADSLVMARLYGEKQSLVDWGGWHADGLRLRRVAAGRLANLPSAIATSADAFPDSESYGAATYLKTAVSLRTLAGLVGRDRFAAAMRTYAQTWAFRHPTGNDLFTTLSAELGEDLGWFVQGAFQRPGGVDYAIRTATCHRQRAARGVFGEGAERRTITGHEEDVEGGGFACQLVVENRGTVPVPVDVEARFADGTTERFRWDARDGSRWRRFEFSRSSTLVEVVLDPDGAVMMADGVTDDHVRLDGDPHAAARASARLAHWTQAIMQVVGL